jgi:hypothetical protein
VGRLTPATISEASIETGSGVVDMMFSRYQPSMLAIAQDSGAVSVWDGLKSCARLTGHRRR